jgi:transcriptional regulator with XRE-family HTH domain
MNLLSTIGRNIRFLRESKGYSQEALAIKAGLQRTYIGDVERGTRNITVLNLAQIASALEAHPGVLLIDNVFRWKGEDPRK